VLKKTKLAAAIAAGMVATSASAVNVSPNGTGEVLVFPYYNVNNGFQTQFSVVNTTNTYKAVKIRLRESNASNDVLDFNLYMSPRDVWTATISASGDGAQLTTADNTCTYPDNAGLKAGVQLRDIYDVTSAADTREGYIEVIEMGTIPTGLLTSGNYNTVALPAGVVTAGAPGKTGTTLVSQIKHNGSGTPVNCGAIQAAWTNAVAGGVPVFTQGGGLYDADLNPANGVNLPGTAGTISANDPLNLANPTGGLMGEEIFLNVSTGSAYVAEPVALQHVSDIGTNGINGAQHYRPDDTNLYLLPSLASGEVGTVDVPHGPGTKVSGATQPDGRHIAEVTWPQTLVDNGLIDPNIAPNIAVPSGVNPFPVANALAVISMANEYFVEAAFDGATDWVVTLPMKKHGIFNGTAPMLDTNATVGGNQPGQRALNNSESGGRADVEIAFSTWSREEQQTTSSDFSPPLQSSISLEKEVNILSLTTSGTTLPTNPVLGSTQAQALGTNFESGWGSITFNGRYDLYNSTVPNRYMNATNTAFIPNAATTYGVEGFVNNVAAGAAVVDISGVPAIGFAAIRGNTGDANVQVGETYPHKVTNVDAEYGL